MMGKSQTMLPRYRQVKKYILSQIRDGKLKADDRVPSEAELVKSMGVSRMTANRALRELTEEGYLVGVPGIGRFIADHLARGHLLEIRNIASEIEERGSVHRAELLRLDEVPATVKTGHWLEVEPGSPIFHSSILHWENDQPLQLENRYVNPRFAPTYLAVDFQQQTPHEYLTAIAPLAEAEHQVQAAMPNPDTQALLKMAAGEPCLVLFRRTWAKGMAASAAHLYHPSSRYVLGERFSANPAQHTT